MKRILFAGLLAAFCAGTAPAMAQSYVIKFAHSLSSTEPAHLAAEYFAKNVGERTKGEVAISVFPSEQLGSGKYGDETVLTLPWAMRTTWSAGCPFSASTSPGDICSTAPLPKSPRSTGRA